MDAARWTDLKDDLARVVDLDPDARTAALDALDPERRAALLPLLAAHDAAGDFLDASPAPVAVAAVAHEALRDPLLGTEVGPYRVERAIGHGGMGDVFLARRTDGLIEQPVALKLVRGGARSDAVLRRFADERRILGRLHHGGIARLLDAGTAPDGRPWIAMDYVEGMPLIEAAEGMSVAERVRLIAETAATVHAAHQALVVHRDLKPSNVLVAPGDDGRLHPTLLDFGIAKVLDDTGEAETETGLRPMTRAYAAPEQVRGEPATTATDVHALGVLLYEMLTGERPFHGDSPTAVEAAIRDSEPTRPSRAVAETSATSSTGTGTRARELRGDLDTICLKALAKAPADRYASADAFEADLRRYLDGQPIAARPPSGIYRARKFIARHPWGVATAVGMVMALLLGGVLHTARVTAERDRAVAAEAEAGAAADFLASVFVSASPFESGRRDTLRLRDLLDEALTRIETDLGDQPALQARLFEPLATAYGYQSRFGLADSLLRAAIARVPPTAAPARARLAVRRGDVLVHWGGEERQAEAIRLYRSALARPGGLADTSRAQTYGKLAVALNRNGAAAEADSSFQAALALYRALGVPDTSKYAIMLGQHAMLLSAEGRDAEALVAVESALGAMQRQLGPDHPHVGVEHYLAGTVLMAAARPAEARTHFEASRRIDAAALGPDHPNTLDGEMMVAVTMLETDRPREAATRLADVTARLEAALGSDDPRLPFYLMSLGAARVEAGDLAAASATLDRALRLMRSIHGADHWGVGAVLTQLGKRDLARGEATAARVHFTDALRMMEAAHGPDNARALRIRLGLARALLAEGRRAEARRAVAPAARAFAERFGADAERTREAQALLAEASAAPPN